MKYMLAILSGPDEAGTPDPERLRAILRGWDELDREMIAAGAFIAGDALEPPDGAATVTVDAAGERLVSDGPFAETKEQLGGYYVLECADRDEAIEWARKLPVRPGSAVEVRAITDFSELGYSSSTPGPLR